MFAALLNNGFLDCVPNAKTKPQRIAKIHVKVLSSKTVNTAFQKSVLVNKLPKYAQLKPFSETLSESTALCVAEFAVIA